MSSDSLVNISYLKERAKALNIFFVVKIKLRWVIKTSTDLNFLEEIVSKAKKLGFNNNKVGHYY